MTSLDTGSLSVIGIFDSGVGGLSVLREIQALLPTVSVIYLGDSAHIPYGTKPVEFIQTRSQVISEFLLARGAQILVVACNSATAAAVSVLRSRFTVPIVGVEPGVKMAVGQSRNGIIGVLATPATLRSQKFAHLLRTHSGSAQVISQPCDGWVEHVERGDLRSLQVRMRVQRGVEPLIARGADTWVLGCTHFPFLLDQIRAAAGPNVTLVDAGAPVAREVRRRLQTMTSINAAEPLPFTEEFWTSGDAARATETYSTLLGRAVTARQIPRNYI